jgi:hypothetical protein
MNTVDLKRTYRDHYRAGVDPQFVEVPARPFLMVDGRGDPNSDPAYRQAVETLYPLAYGLRAAVKERTGIAYTVMPLEGLWWAEDMRAFRRGVRADWQWTLMICQPDVVTADLARDVLPAVTAAKGLPVGEQVRLEAFEEGLAVQVLHRGPYADEAPTIDRLHAYLGDAGYRPAGKHHEIYLSDPRRTDPHKLRTIIRQPVVARRDDG